MNLWEKIKHGVHEGVTVVSEKASDWVEAGGEFIKEGVERFSDEQIDSVGVSKLRSEVDELREKIKGEFTALGGEVYVLHTSGKKAATEGVIEVHLQKLEQLRDELESKEHQLAELSQKYEAQSIATDELKRFKAELEAAGGDLQHIVIEDSSPFAGRTLSEIETPEDILIGLIIRRGSTIIPKGDTEIESGDRIMLMGKKEAVVEMLTKLEGANQDE